MEKQIAIREAITENEITTFFTQLRLYHERDIFPSPNDADLAYFLGREYREQILAMRNRSEDRCRFVFFDRDGRNIGFALPVIYNSEDGKCFIMEFCVYPPDRGNGVGKQCAKALLDWAAENGAHYAELNYGGDARRRRFWSGLGFLENGADEWGNPLMTLPPKEDMPIAVERLCNPDDWQLLKLENGFKREIGEDTLTEKKQQALQRAIKDGRIVFFVAKRGHRLVGMCSVARCYSTFSCADTGVFEDFYIEPVFRKQGIARKLAKAAQDWCRENGIESLTVCAAPCDEAMYRALGFDAHLGRTFAHME